MISLAADEPEVARRDIHESMAKWPSERFLLQQWHVMQGESEIDLYIGNCAVAYDRFMRDMPALKKSLLLSCQFVRIMTMYSQGKHAIASAGELPDLARRRLREAGGLARRLEGSASSGRGSLPRSSGPGSRSQKGTARAPSPRCAQRSSWLERPT